MAAHDDDSRERAAQRPLGADLAAHVEAIVRAAEREAQAAQRAIEERRRSAEEEARRYLATAQLHVDAEAAARAARLETFSAAARRLADELADAAAALTRELRAGAGAQESALPPAPWPEPPAEEQLAPAAAPEPAAPAPAPPAPEPTWERAEPAPEPQPAAEQPPTEAETTEAAAADVPTAARLVAIEMAVGGSSRADVEQHLRAELGVEDPEPLLDDVFGPASHAGSRLAWGEP
jgi:hypothetical protein